MTNDKYVTSYQLAKRMGKYSEREIDLLHNIASLLSPSSVICIDGNTDGVEALCIAETIDSAIVLVGYHPLSVDWLILPDAYNMAVNKPYISPPNVLIKTLWVLPKHITTLVVPHFTMLDKYSTDNLYTFVKDDHTL